MLRLSVMVPGREFQTVVQHMRNSAGQKYISYVTIIC